jgi:hypothetical protein
MAFDFNLEGSLKKILCQPFTVLRNRSCCLTFVVFVEILIEKFSL